MQWELIGCLSEDIKGCVGERGKVTETEMPGTGLDFRYGRLAKDNLGHGVDGCVYQAEE